MLSSHDNIALSQQSVEAKSGELALADKVNIENNHVKFIFSDQARQEAFIKILSDYIPIKNITVNQNEIQLTEIEFDAWLGDGSFHALSAHNNSPKHMVQEKLESLLALNDKLLQVALLLHVSDFVNTFGYAIVHMLQDNFTMLVERIPNAMCDHLAIPFISCSTSTDSISFLDLILMFKRDSGFISFINRLNDATYNQVVLSHHRDGDIGNTLLRSLSLKSFTAYSSRLSPETLDITAPRHIGALLTCLENPYCIDKSILYNYLKRFTQRTWDAIFDIGNDWIMISVWSVIESADGEDFIHLVNQLSSQACTKMMTAVYANLDPDLGSLISNKSPDEFMLFFKKIDNTFYTNNLRFKSQLLSILYLISLKPYSVNQLNEFIDKFDLAVLMDVVFGADPDVEERATWFIKQQSNPTSPIFSLLLSKIFHNPALLKDAYQKYPQLFQISIHDGGVSDDVWWTITDKIIKSIKAPQQDRTINRMQSNTERYPNYPEWNQDLFKYCEDNHLTFMRLQGRTILLEDILGNITALKVQKAHELPTVLEDEYNTNMYLHASQLADQQLQSAIAKPLSISIVSGIYSWLKKQVPLEEFNCFVEMTSSDNIDHVDPVVYRYSISSQQRDYFTYLHDSSLSDSKFKQANRITVHDLYFMFMRHIIYSTFADVFHNKSVVARKDGGRYAVLSNFIRHGTFGTGRVEAWEEAIKYANARASGIADLGDKTLFSDYMALNPISGQYFKEAFKSYKKMAGNYILANFIAEYQFILCLIAGARGKALTESAKLLSLSDSEREDVIKKIWLTLAEQILLNCAQAAAIMTNQPEYECHRILSSIVSVDLLAKQMNYWMTTKYVNDLPKNSIPTEIYGPSVVVRVDFAAFRAGTYNAKIGCSMDGKNQDLGVVNGQEPIKEANKLFYWFVTLVANAQVNTSMTLSQLRMLSKIKDPYVAETSRPSLFPFLSKYQENRLQIQLCKERLSQTTPFPDDLREKVQKELHERSNESRLFTQAHYIKQYLYHKKHVAVTPPSSQTTRMAQ